MESSENGYNVQGALSAIGTDRNYVGMLESSFGLGRGYSAQRNGLNEMYRPRPTEAIRYDA